MISNQYEATQKGHLNDKMVAINPRVVSYFGKIP